MRGLKIVVLIPLLWLGSCKNKGLGDKKEIIKTGKISLKVLKKYDWFGSEYKRYVPKEAYLDSIKGLSNYSILIYGGDWCSDTKFYLPQFIKILDAVHFPEERLSIYFVDRGKQCDKCGMQSPEKYKITRVPTFIILDTEGNEKGRITESPIKSLEEDLAGMGVD